MNSSNSDNHLAGSLLEQHRQVCAFFHSAEEEYGLLLPFISFRKVSSTARSRFTLSILTCARINMKHLAQASIDVAAASERATKTNL